MRVDSELIKSELNLKIFGAQGWLTDKDKACPFCSKSGKWGIIVKADGGVFHCWKCGKKTNLQNYLYAIDRKDLIQIEYNKSIKARLTPLVKEDEGEKEKKELEPVTLPFRLQPFENDPYLDERGFQKYHYKEFEPSFTNSTLERGLKNYIIFKIKQEGKVVAWLARSRYSKEWHKENLDKSKITGVKPKLRYENSTGTDFTKLLGGINFLKKGEVQTVILVEGLFDFINIDNLLDLSKGEDLKCCFLFGNSVSKEQISLLKEKQVKKIILMLDFNTTEESKSAGLILSTKFETKVAYITKKDIDPGNIDLDYLEEILSKLEDPVNFFANHIKNRWR